MSGPALHAPSLAGRRYAVFGLARSGLAAVGFLRRSGADVAAWDDRAEARAAAEAAHPGLALADPMAVPLAGLAGLVVSPGVPLNRHPLAARAREAGVPVIGDMELFQAARATFGSHRLVGITGTNGKSTTTALLHHIVAGAGVPAALAGNIGTPILDAAPLPAGGVWVVEISSFQVDLSRTLACDLAILTNITRDHLDRYASFAAYAAAKARLFAMQPDGATAVIATDDPQTRAIADAEAARLRVIRVSAADIAPAEQAGWPALAGPHNAQNAACAIAAARALGLPADAIARGLATYRGLPHRLETVATVSGVRFVNDSKATNPESAAPALRAFPGIHWIAGGQAKTDDLDACLPHLGNVRAAYLVGEAAARFAAILAPHVPVVRSGTVEQAVRDAARAARPGETVLLAPACASFDQFRDYAERGEAFRAAVEALGETAHG
ncbi:UDP-N-acetylmuramoyl-L-alanine--D-glutamate ligase [Thermaurantiacus tibetensis]|uniref:UDP-N-acetylmuramoyl-L-alanine--D-glutamate ligase n=1 Tax=Thermaurantiacus tibetensis TaxID=2759035 RepID=UPI00188F785D|nr:UDP-N-acetylmuramoyl-L-alanine--D-glutamate ligase [Thermaurantiacus tibetensis]